MQVFGLRRVCLSPRTYQQACRASSRAVKRSQQRKTRPSSLPDRLHSSEDSEEVNIKWFEHDVSTGRTRRVQENPEEVEAAQMREEITRLRNELKAYEGEDDDFEKTLLDNLSPEERRKVERALNKREHQVTSVTSGLEISTALPPIAGSTLNRLNKCLHEAALHPRETLQRKELWRWYIRAKRQIPTLPLMLPERAWKVLWDVLSRNGPFNPDRDSHVVEITNDLQAAKIALSTRQKIDRQQSLIAVGRTSDALAEWEAEYESTAGRDADSLERGILLFSEMSDPDLALTKLQEYVENFRDSKPRAMLPLIEAYVRSENTQMAYALYNFMRQLLQSNMQMQDYDAIIAIFMNNDLKDMALAVFRDMMLQGTRAMETGAISGGDQVTDLRQELMGRLRFLQSGASDSRQLNKISLQSLSSLPRQWQNRYFYASWMKKLIGEGNLRYAELVLNLMFEREVKPGAIHVNGLIGAFLRSGDAELQQKGEELAWAMIQERLDMVAARKSQNGMQSMGTDLLTTTTDEVSEFTAQFPISVKRPLPAASPETFNLMGLHYLIKEQWSSMEFLDNVRKVADIQLTTYFMNNLLYKRLYSTGAVETWQEFIGRAPKTMPDLQTFDCLWTAALRDSKPAESQDGVGFPSHRRLFQVTIGWFDDLPDKNRQAAQEAFDYNIYAKIMHAFLRDQDYTGALVVMHVIAWKFEVYPGGKVAASFVNALSSFHEKNVSKVRDRGGRKKIGVDKARARKIAEVLEALSKKRETRRQNSGIVLDETNATDKALESLNLLSELVRFVIVRSGVRMDRVEPSIDLASREMGVGGIVTGDVDASNVG